VSFDAHALDVRASAKNSRDFFEKRDVGAADMALFALKQDVLVDVCSAALGVVDLRLRSELLVMLRGARRWRRGGFWKLRIGWGWEVKRFVVGGD